MSGRAAAHALVVGVGPRAAGITYGGRIYARCFPKAPLRTPETTKREHSLLQVVRELAAETGAVCKSFSDPTASRNRLRLKPTAGSTFG